MVHFDGKLLGVFQRVFDIIWDICGARPALCFITGFCRVTSVFKLNIWFEQSHHCCCKTNLIFSQYAIFQFYLWLPIVGYKSLYLAMWEVCYWCWYFGESCESVCNETKRLHSINSINNDDAMMNDVICPCCFSAASLRHMECLCFITGFWLTTNVFSLIFTSQTTLYHTCVNVPYDFASYIVNFVIYRS